MVLPLLLAAGAGVAGLSLFSDSAGDKAVDVTGEIVEKSFEVMGVGLVRGGQGAIRALKEESKGHGVEITATLTVITIAYFYFKRYIQ